MGECSKKHQSPHHHKEIRATYLYMENTLLKINHKIVNKWSNAVLTPIYMVLFMPIHMVAITPDHTVLQGCANVVRRYKHTNITTVT